MKYRPTCAVLAVSVTLAVLFLHAWYFSRSHVPSVFGLASFGITCILLSFLNLPAQKPVSHKATVISIAASERNAAASAPVPRASEPMTGVTNAFTVDFEDYFHTEVASRTVPPSRWDSMPARLPATTPRILDLLDRYEVRATFFVLGWVAQRHPALVKQIAERRHEVACHSNRHRAVFRLTPEEFKTDTVEARARIEDLTGKQVRGYRAPSFSITPGTEWAFDVLAELGFEYDSSVNPIYHKFYGNPTAPRFPYVTGNKGLLEIPVATRRVAGRNLPVSGGAYLRLLPTSYLMAGLEHINQREGRPFTVYVHPWEIDSYQAPMDLDWKSQIRQASGTDTMEAKIEDLLRSFRFGSMAEVYAGMMPATYLPVAEAVLQAA